MIWLLFTTGYSKVSIVGSAKCRVNLKGIVNPIGNLPSFSPCGLSSEYSNTDNVCKSNTGTTI